MRPPHKNITLGIKALPNSQQSTKTMRASSFPVRRHLIYHLYDISPATDIVYSGFPNGFNIFASCGLWAACPLTVPFNVSPCRL